MYKKYVKRILDVILSGLALILLSPLMGLVAFLVKVKLGSPVIFKQIRPGRHEKLFPIYKFRSMSNAKDKNGDLLPDADRLTHFGRVLRSTSLDELPELFNIFKGDMSIVGPRPLAVEYLPFYNDEEKHRHDVSPGLTGLAQVNGRNALQWEERFKYDIEYVEKLSFLLDAEIVLMTVGKVLKKQDIVTRGEGVTMDFDVYRKEQAAGKKADLS